MPVFKIIQKVFSQHYEQLTLSGLTLHCHLHPLQAANCCRNSQLVVDEDDLKWLKIKENCNVLVHQFHGNFRSKTLGRRRINYVFRDLI